VGIRRAEPADVPTIERIVEHAYEKYVARGLMRPAPMDDDHLAKVENGRAYVLEADGRVVGVVELLQAEDHVLVENVAIAPRLQGQGHGRKLLEFAERWAADRGIATLNLYTQEGMTENVALYRALGWVEQERKLDDGFRRVFFKKELPLQSTV
jgi:GNAT superfamily N-acetyltransferase